MVYYIDIDGTICEANGKGYDMAKPIPDAIAKVNQYMANGDTVILWTARGTETGRDWQFVTRDQLKNWGCRYTELRFGKPAWDRYIGDRATSAKDWWAE